MPRTGRTTAKRTAPATTRAFLFSDLRDYTTFVETHGDAAAAALLREYRTLVRKEVARRKGAEVKTEGDSFYVVFDSASVALDCAVGILRKVNEHNEKQPERKLRVGVGLHAGETIAFDKQFVGSAVNVASRLASRAEAGELLVSDTLRGLVRTGRSYPMTDRGALALKGVSEPIQAWSVAIDEGASAPTFVLPPTPAPRAPPAAGQILCPVVIGRDAELAQAEAALDAAVRGRGQTILVAGEAGGGKSAFVREAQSRAQARGFRVLLGATLESDRTLPYAPFIAAVRSGFRGIERERLGRVLAQTAPDLAQLFPELGRAPRPDASLEQHRLTVAFHGLFTAFAREAPILIVLEDLHWSDEASLDLLHYLARELSDSRSVLLATYRSDEMHRRHPFLRTHANLQRERLATEIALRRLNAEEIGALIAATFAVTEPGVPPTRVTPEFRDAIFARSEGNPFFTEELLKALVESRDLVYTTEEGWKRTRSIEQLRIPSSIREAVHARIERLSVDGQATLSAASVIGLRFPFEVLRSTAGPTGAELLAHLRQFIELQLVLEIGGDEDEYAFRHALTREVVYDELLAPERKALHRSVAEVLASRQRTEPSLLAYHLIAAGEQARAVPQLLEAARRAMAADAPREAAAHYERALEIGVADDAIASAMEGLAAAYLRFDISRCRRAAERALELYRKADDRRGTSRALMLLGNAGAMLAEPRTRALIEEARAVVEDLGDTPELAHALARFGWQWMMGRRTGTGELRGLAERLALLGERLNDPFSRAEAAYLEGFVAMDERPEEALVLVRRGRDLALEAGLAESVVRGYWLVSMVMQRDRSTDEVVASIEEGLAYARRHGIEEVPLVPMSAYVRLNRGEWDEALAGADKFAQDSPSWYDNALEIRARVAEGRDGPEAAAALYSQHAAAWRALTGGDNVPALMSTAYAAVLLEDRAGAAAALEALRHFGAREDQMVSVGRARLLVCSVVLGETDWIDALERSASDEMAYGRGLRAACRATRAFLQGDLAECGREMTSHYALKGPSRASLFGLDTATIELVVAFVREARSRGWSLGPEWDEPIAHARAFAEKAKATWWLGALAKAH